MYEDTISVSPEDKASEDNMLRVWDLESGQVLRTLQGHVDAVNCMTITPDGSRVVSGSHDETMRLWDLESGEEVATFTGESGINGCAVAPDGQTIVAGERSGRVHFLRLVEADKTSLK